jgi:hypothetical protein
MVVGFTTTCAINASLIPTHGEAYLIKHYVIVNIKNTKFVKDLPMIDAQFRFNQCNSFREEYISVFSRYGPVLIL